MNLETLLRIPDVETAMGHDLSPDGSRIAFAWNLSGRWEIYEMPLPSKSKQLAGVAPTSGGYCRASSGHGGKVAPRYSPDNNFLAWAVDMDGSENFHIIVEDLVEGLSIDLDEGVEYAISPFFAWSPDSKQIAYLADKRGNFDLYIRNVDGSNDRFIFSPGGPAHFVRWSPDGAHIAIAAEKEWQTDGAFIVPLDGGPAQRIGGDEKPLDAFLPIWSPDSRRVAFCSTSPGWTQIGLYHLSDGRIEWITSGESDHLNPAWSPDGKRLCWVNNQSEKAWVEIFTFDEREPLHCIETPSGFAHLPLFTTDSQSVVFVYENPHRPPDLWLASLADGRLTQLTDSLPSSLRGSKLVAPEAIRYPSMDGTSIPAMLYKPEGASPRSSAVVVIHGGPSFHLAHYWNPILSYLASRGWTVIAPNYRGSTGYGRAWMISNRFEMGRLDTEDCSAAAIYLAKEGLADPKKIAVTGRSHGGYLTMSCMTSHPDLWAGGSAVVPFLNWFTGHKNSREDLQYWDICNMGDPQKYHDLWHERSPFFFLDKVRAPVQLIAGENDPRCPPSESTAAHENLLELGVESELHIYKGEGHGFLKLENVIDSELKRVEFLARVLEK
jgi:dipeptidyl aminopeptidase/acylaminoacyl peptidase